MPLYLFSESDRAKKFDEFCNESLFRYLYSNFDMDELSKIGIYSADIWDEAKKLACKILGNKFPEIKWKSLTTDYFNSKNAIATTKKGHDVFVGVYGETPLDISYRYMLQEKIYTCLYCMLLSTMKSFPNENKYKALEHYVDNQQSKIFDVVDTYNNFLDGFDAKIIELDYDYTKKPEENTQSEENVCTDSHSEDKYAAQLKEKDERIKELEEEVSVSKQGPIVVDPHDKVRLEIVTRLLEKSGANFEKHGNKAEAARMAEYLTDLPFQTCKNYMTYRDLNTTEHSEEVLRANTSLMKIGINWQL